MSGGKMSRIKVRDLKFRYGKKIVLNNISFEVGEGEILMILGPNGSGKTTLLKCLNKLLKPEGAVLIDSFEISKLNEKEFAKLVGYVPQLHTPVYPYRVIDVVVSGRTPYLGLSMPTRKDYELAYDILNRFGLGHLADKPYTQLSGGELRLALIARALVQQPRILLLDEPTSHLDFKNKVLVLRILRDIAREGLAMVISEHDPNLASVFSDKLLILYEGRIIGYGKVEDVLTVEHITKVYGIDVEIFERNGKRYIFPTISLRSAESSL